MQRRRETFLASALLVAALLVVAACSSGKTPKAVFIILDGIPADVLESASTPTIDEIAAAGGYTRAYLGGEVGGESESPTVSAVGYQSLLTGTWANKHNVWTNDVENPNYRYWDIFRIAKHHDAALKTAVFSTWEDNRTRLIGDGLEQAGGSKLDHFADGFEKDTDRFPHDDRADYIRDIDQHVASAAADYIAQSGPDLTWVYLQYTDDVGHEVGDSPLQLAAVTDADAMIAGIWDALKQREASHDEDWLIVVTTDHGRDAATGKEHGEQSERERTIWIATNSTRLNERFRQRPAIVDILPSIAAHLSLSIPADVEAQLDGRSFIERRDRR